MHSKIFLFFILITITLSNFYNIYALNYITQKEKRIFNQHLQNGIKYFELKKYKSAINELKKALKIIPKNPVCFYYIGISYKKLNNFKKSIEYLENTLKIKSDWIDVIKELIILYKKTKNYNKAISLTKKSLLLAKNKNIFLEQLYDIYMEKNDFELAKVSLYKLIENQPDNIRLLEKLLKCEINLKNTEIAKAISRRILKLDPKNKLANNLLKKQSEKKFLNQKTNPINNLTTTHNKNIFKKTYNPFFYILIISLLVIFSILIIITLLIRKNDKFIVFIYTHINDKKTLKIINKIFPINNKLLNKILEKYIKNTPFLIDFFIKTINFFDPNISILERIISKAEKDGYYKEIIPIYKYIITRFNTQEMNLRLANCFIKVRSYKKAYDIYFKLIQKNPDIGEKILTFIEKQKNFNINIPDFYEFFGDICKLCNLNEKALILYESIYDVKKEPSLILKIINTALDCKEYNKASNFIENLVMLKPNNITYISKALEIYFYLKNYPLFTNYLERFLKKTHTIPEKIINMHNKLLNNHEYIKECQYIIPVIIDKLLFTKIDFSQPIIDNFLTIYKNDPIIVKKCVEFYLHNKKIKNILNILKTTDHILVLKLFSIKILRKNFDYELANILIDRIESEKFKKELLKLILLLPENKNKYNLLKKIYNHPIKKTFYLYKIYLYNKKDNIRKYLKELNYLFKKRNSPFISYIFLKILSLSKTKTNDLKHLENLLKKYPRSDKIIFLLTKTIHLFNTKNIIEKLKNIDNNFRHNPAILCAISLIYLNQKNYNEAIEYAKKAFNLYKNSTTIICILGYIYLNSGLLEKSYGFYCWAKKRKKLKYCNILDLKAYIFQKKFLELENIIKNINYSKITLNIYNTEFNFKKSYHLERLKEEKTIFLYALYLFKMKQFQKSRKIIMNILSNLNFDNIISLESQILLAKAYEFDGIIDLAHKHLINIKENIMMYPWLKKRFEKRIEFYEKLKNRSK